MLDSFGTRASFEGRHIVDLGKLERRFPGMATLPIATRILLENLLRHENGTSVTSADIEAVARGQTGGQTGPKAGAEVEIAFHPGRVVMQDYAGLPVLLDLAGLRDAAAARGLDPARLHPAVPSALVIDHSLIAETAGRADAATLNLAREFEANAERFAFLKWAQRAFDRLRVVPPGKGIVHQVHIEHLAEVVSERTEADGAWLHPDTVIGTDSHTPMVNGLGVLGWGVGGIEAEAVLLGEAVSMQLPPVLGIRLEGDVPAGLLATDVVLALAERLRRHGVVGAMLEFYGPGVAALAVADRATIANMTPEFGATCSFFPTDARTLDYLRLTGRDEGRIALIEAYLRRNRLWFDPGFVPAADDHLTFRLDGLRRVVSGPSRPEQARDLADLPAVAAAAIGTARTASPVLKDGDVAIAAITSCTNTSNPAALLAAGLLARRAVARGLTVPAHVKTSLAPGSQVVTDYLASAGCLDALAALGFDVVGYACATCVGNGGGLKPEIEAAYDAAPAHLVSVLSGNRNFEGRIHAKLRSNFLASPPLVVAYALAGTVCLDLTRDPLGHDRDGRPVFLDDLWPGAEEIDAALAAHVTRAPFLHRYSRIDDGPPDWQALATTRGACFPWDPASTFLRSPPFFDLPPMFAPGEPALHRARPLLVLGDMVTTDHISPVGPIAAGSPAAAYLGALGIAPAQFNAYGARRGAHEVMVRGTFAGTRLRNELVDRPGGITRLLPEDRTLDIHAASRDCQARGEELIVVAGKMYGAGSARDWASKGTRLLGIKAVLAESFERIHRANLVRMGVLPLEFAGGANRLSLGIGGADRLSLALEPTALAPRQQVPLLLHRADGTTTDFAALLRVDTSVEMDYLRAGGILPYVAERLWARARSDQVAPT
ncbi:aconitate hydratase AcnA [Ancylobacter polymorphus]|uniref:Aconitate hydratase n=1 Tax=Ancylobacter polymorphus TaxID=223390 RepID=A0ABU0BAS9_9HYPH|nr:aconitate hydratase AcnA [Ancylobacter polymorphus]MDQ0302946.1 aconitate hydratase [Ancylobacter polymorphus]